jgi:cold shock CspA family protein
MRYQGRVTTWILDKGYGFIKASGVGREKLRGIFG